MLNKIAWIFLIPLSSSPLQTSFYIAKRTFGGRGQCLNLNGEMGKWNQEKNLVCRSWVGIGLKVKQAVLHGRARAIFHFHD